MSLYLNDTSAFLYYISKYYLIFFILQQVGAEVSGLFTLQTVAHLFRPVSYTHLTLPTSDLV